MATMWLTSLILGQFAVVDVAPVPETVPQAIPQAIHRGAKNVSFGFWQSGNTLGRPSGSIGGTYFVTDKVAVGLQAKVDLDRIRLTVPTTAQEETLTQLSVSLVPQVRYYLMAVRPVASYLTLGVSGGYTRTPETSQVNNQVGTGQVKGDGFLDVLMAFGAEWFMVPSVSLSGELGLSVQAVRPNNQSAPSLHTVSSLLQANFYW